MTWTPAVLCAALIFWASSLPIPYPIARIIALSDKLFHAVAYGVLAIAVAFALHVAHSTTARRTAWLSGLIAALYGALDEWHQVYIPGRCADLVDVLADGVGAVLAAVGVELFLTHHEKRRTKTTSG